MQKVRCDLTGEDSEWFDTVGGTPPGWTRISFNYCFTRNEQFYNGNKVLLICPNAIVKLLPGVQPQPKEESFMELLRGFIDDEIADALANQ